MASVFYGQALLEVLDGSATNPLNLVGDAKVKWMLVGSPYTPNYDDTIVDAGGASDAIDGEINATGYTGGYGGADRTAIAGEGFTNDTGNNRVEFDANDVTWSSLGNGTNDTITHILLVKEDHLGVAGNDTETRLIFAIDVTDTTTNGGDITAQWDAEGIVQFA